MTERIPFGPRKPRPTVFADRVRHEDDLNCWYGRYNTAHFTFTVRAHDGQAIRFYSEIEALNAARYEWWQHVNGDAATNQKINKEARHERLSQTA